MRAVILAGGQGVRLRPLTYAVPVRARRFDGVSLAVDQIGQLEGAWRGAAERRA